jgi:hypothetical protein
MLQISPMCKVKLAKFPGILSESERVFYSWFPAQVGPPQSSSVGESHPYALTDPDVSLSAHPAPIDQPQVHGLA